MGSTQAIDLFGMASRRSRACGAAFAGTRGGLLDILFVGVLGTSSLFIRAAFGLLFRRTCLGIAGFLVSLRAGLLACGAALSGRGLVSRPGLLPGRIGRVQNAGESKDHDDYKHAKDVMIFHGFISRDVISYTVMLTILFVFLQGKNRSTSQNRGGGKTGIGGCLIDICVLVFYMGREKGLPVVDVHARLGLRDAKEREAFVQTRQDALAAAG